MPLVSPKRQPGRLQKKPVGVHAAVGFTQVHQQLAATDDDVIDCAQLALMRHAGARPE